jgi:hypothetical protein
MRVPGGWGKFDEWGRLLAIKRTPWKGVRRERLPRRGCLGAADLMPRISVFYGIVIWM